MNQAEFLKAFRSIRKSYKWQYVNNQLVGVAKYGMHRGFKFNPITAVARSYAKNGYYENNGVGTSMAAASIALREELYNAIMSKSNRGHAQIIRGHMLKSLEG